jgi:hypothetical protein
MTDTLYSNHPACVASLRVSVITPDQLSAMAGMRTERDTASDLKDERVIASTGTPRPNRASRV